MPSQISRNYNKKIFWIGFCLAVFLAWAWLFPIYSQWQKDFHPDNSVNQDLLEIADKAMLDNNRSISLPAVSDARKFNWSDSAKEKKTYDFFSTFTDGSSMSFRNPYGALMLHYLNAEIEKNHPVGEYLQALGIEKVYLRQDLANISGFDHQKNFDLFLADPNLELEDEGELVKVFNVLGPNPEMFSNEQSLAVIGGMEAFRSLLQTENFELPKNDIFFAQQMQGNGAAERIEAANFLVFTEKNSRDDLAFSMLQNGITLAPAEYTVEADPETSWVRASIYEPLHGEWHRTVRDAIGEENWDFDYGHGLVYTNRQNTESELPVILKMDMEITSAGEYNIGARVFENIAGGDISIKIDNGEWYKLDASSARPGLKWRQITTADLEIGTHQVYLRTYDGFNAVNVISFAKSEEFNKSREKAESLLANKPIIQTLSLGPDTLLGDELDLDQLNSQENVSDLHCLSSSCKKLEQDDFPNLDIAGYFKLDQFATKLPDQGSIISTHNTSTKQVTPEQEIGFVTTGNSGSVTLGPFTVSASSDYYFIVEADVNEADHLVFRTHQYHDAQKLAELQAVAANRYPKEIERSDGRVKLVIPANIRNGINYVALEVIAKSEKNGFEWQVTSPLLIEKEQLENFVGSASIYPQGTSFSNEQIACNAKKENPGMAAANCDSDVSSFSLTRTYDNLWRSIDSMKENEIYPNYSSILSFDLGSSSSQLEALYYPQRVMRLGQIISALSAAVLIALIVIFYKRRRTNTQKNKLYANRKRGN